VGSEILAVHMDQFYKGSVAAFTVAKGAGRISYIGFDEPAGVSRLLKTICELEGMAKDAACFLLPANTLLMERGKLTIFLNYNDVPVEVPDALLHSRQIVLGQKEVEPAGVALLRPFNERRK
jgi:hypothetical protein